jgi:cytochrome c oxidase cbb3-type subunit 3
MKAAELALVALALLAGCKREERNFRVSAPAAAREQGLRLVELQPGPRANDRAAANGYEENALAMNEGRVLFGAFNCVGCHGHGGGGMGPPLLDEKWRYGSEPAQVFATIMEGRPNGMPSFRGKVNADQAWKLVAYVRSLGGLVPQDAAPARPDHMKNSAPPNSVDSGPPPQPEKAP